MDEDDLRVARALSPPAATPAFFDCFAAPPLRALAPLFGAVLRDRLAARAVPTLVFDCSTTKIVRKTTSESETPKTMKTCEIFIDNFF